MKKILAFSLIAIALVAGAAFVACGGGDEEEEERPAATESKDGEEKDENGDETPEAKATKETETEDEDGEDAGDAKDSLDGVPIYPGANEVMSGEWSGSEAPIPMLGSEGANPEDYGEVRYGMYEIDDSPEDVFEWYKGHMDDWEEEWVFSSSGEEGGGGIGIWSQDGGKKAAWVVVSEEGENTSLMLMSGSQ